MLEVCVDSLISARAAIAGGADRLELCSALSVGGLTPYLELLSQIRQESDIPIRCLMRPRAGDFLYTEEEIRMLEAQMQALHKAGADGFVIGALKADGTLDAEVIRRLQNVCPQAQFTLHRCIDVSVNIAETYVLAGKLGFDTVLTSGGKARCTEGKETIKKLLAYENGPQVLIGAGVNAAVIGEFRKEMKNATAFHMSGKKERESQMVFRREGVPMGIPNFSEWTIAYTDEEAVREAKKALKNGVE